MTFRAPLLRGALAPLVLAAGLLPAPSASAHVPAPLSGERSHVSVASAFGSGSFGRWTVDGFGLPAYRYDIDERVAPQARQPELDGSTDAWHQVGNDHVVADAFNHGYVQLWSQDRLYQWANRYEAAAEHFSGGYGYLRAGGRVISTLYSDRPRGARTQRYFGPGYTRDLMRVPGVSIDQSVYAPFGDDPVLLHDVTIHNSSRTTLRASWFEYWDVNPYDQAAHTHVGLRAPSYDAPRRTLSVAQASEGGDSRPLSLYLAALRAPVRGFETSVPAFFGAGGRARPAAVLAGRLRSSIAPPTADGAPGRTLMAMRSPVRVAPGHSTTLRYAYGIARRALIARLVTRYRASRHPFATSERRWARWLPQVSFGGSRWLARELQWDAYMVRSGATYEERCGHHILSQGGYYQYDLGFQGAFRDPLQHMLPMIYADPVLARDVLLYSAQEQPRRGTFPYSMEALCHPHEAAETSDDLDLWLLLGASEYAMGARDFGVLDRRVRFANGGSASLWTHLKLAFRHQESLRGPHGGYLAGPNGDWSDFSSIFLHMTESTLVTAQLAYVYPRLALVADARGDRAFARTLRLRTRALMRTLRRQWTGGGWYSRGYDGDRQLGAGAIFGEPQPWAILAGAPSPTRARRLVANVRRFLTGVGAPARLHGPSRIGSSLTPARDDPAVTERSTPASGGGPAAGVGDGNSNYVGGTWFAVNGWLTWALATLDGVVPHAANYAWSEFERNTLAAHATAYPRHWDGILSVDDVCWSYYSSHPDRCGAGLSTTYDTQILHQPAWSLFDAIRLAGVDPTGDGYRIAPALPFRRFDLRLPSIGVRATDRALQGYVRPQAGGRIVLRVRLPHGVRAASAVTWAGRRRIAHASAGRWARFGVAGRRGAAADWTVTWR